MDLEPNNLTYDILVAGYAKKSNKVDALRMYCDMVSKGFIPKTSTYNSLINDFAKAGMMNQAKELFKPNEKERSFRPCLVSLTNPRARKPRKEFFMHEVRNEVYLQKLFTNGYNFS